jgi:hypothetical protein
MCVHDYESRFGLKLIRPQCTQVLVQYLTLVVLRVLCYIARWLQRDRSSDLNNLIFLYWSTRSVPSELLVMDLGWLLQPVVPRVLQCSDSEIRVHSHIDLRNTGLSPD